MTGTAACSFTNFLPMIVAIAIAVILFGVPFYLVRRRIRSQIEQGEPATEQEPEQPTVQMEVTPVNDSEPKLAQEPAITSAPIAVDPNPVPPVKPARKRTAKKAATEEKKAEKPAKSKKEKKVTKTERKTVKPAKTEKKAKPAKGTSDDVKIAVKDPAKLSRKSTKKTTKSK